MLFKNKIYFNYKFTFLILNQNKKTLQTLITISVNVPKNGDDLETFKNLGEQISE